LFREQPPRELARSARLGVDLVLSPNDRLQQRLHPWSSYVFVPLFALANAGIVVNGHVLSRAFSGPITLGIVIGLVAGKPLGVLAASALARWLSRGRLRLPVGWGSAAGTGAVAGIAFTVSLLIASRAFHGTQLQDAKLGILTEAARAQGRFWEMHDLLFQHQDALRPPDLVRYAEELGLDVDRFKDDLRRHVHAGRVARDVESADLSGVAGTPTFFVNGRRHQGA